MGLYAFTEWCIHALWNRIEGNPYTLHDMDTITPMLYDQDYWYGVIATREWTASLYG